MGSWEEKHIRGSDWMSFIINGWTSNPDFGANYPIEPIDDQSIGERRE